MKIFHSLLCISIAIGLIAGCSEGRSGKPAGNIIVVQKEVKRTSPANAGDESVGQVAAAPQANPQPAEQNPPVIQQQSAEKPPVKAQPAAQKPEQTESTARPSSNSVQKDGVLLTLNVSETRLIAGQNVTAELTVKNTTDKAITIHAVGDTPVFARIYRQTVTYQDEVKRYPQTGVVYMNDWQLAPGQEKKFTLSLPVEPDWPTNEPLKLTMELNGLPKAAPAVNIRVAPN